MDVVPLYIASSSQPTFNHIDPILRLPQIKALTGLGKTSIYEAMRQGTFPASRSLGLRSVGWFQSDIHQWLESRKLSSQKKVMQ